MIEVVRLPSSRLGASAILLLLACSTPPVGKSPAEPDPIPSPEDAAPALERDARPSPALNAVSEIEARELLANLFRAAGYRILYDVSVTSGDRAFAIDGYDPIKRVGYEYIAPAEIEAVDRLRAANIESVLVLQSASRDTIESLAKKFLAALAAQSAAQSKTATE